MSFPLKTLYTYIITQVNVKLFLYKFSNAPNPLSGKYTQHTLKVNTAVLQGIWSGHLGD
jgi:hypothetical protein